MKKVKITVWILFIALFLLNIGLAASAASTVYQGLTFTDTDTYQTPHTDLDLPATYEATLYFLPSTSASTRGGVIFGNYSSAEKSCFSFEIHKNGNPRIYIIDANETAHNIVFTNVNVYTGEIVHIAITVDWATGTYQCYLNGQLKQTIKDDTFSPFQLTDIFCLGGDQRDNNTQYFKGAIQKVSLYGDIRSAQEIASDAQAAAFDADSLLAAYDLTAFTFGSKPATAPAAKGPDLTYAERQTWLPEAPAIGEYDYSFALVGDIQTLNWYFPDKLPKIFDWLTANAQSEKIAHVFHLGDITDRDTPEEWALAKAQYNRLNGVVPYTFVRGNHDSIAQYNTYMNDTDYAHLVDGSFDGTMLNTYKIFTAGDLQYLIVSLDLTASDEVLAWANKLVEDHPDHNVIVTTHIYLSAAGKHTTYLKYDATNSGQQLWDKFISQHENITMVFCGHSSSDQIMLTRSTGVHGNEVVQILVDPQITDTNHDATGLVAMLYFSEGSNHVDLRYYSTVKNQYFLASNQFSFDLDTSKQDAPPAEDGDSTTQPPEQSNEGEISLTYKIIIAVILVIGVTEIVILIMVLRKKRN